MTFNEWMLHIHEQLNYPKGKLRQYEQSIRGKGNISGDQRNSPKSRDRQQSRSYKVATIIEETE